MAVITFASPLDSTYVSNVLYKANANSKIKDTQKIGRQTYYKVSIPDDEMQDFLLDFAAKLRGYDVDKNNEKDFTLIKIEAGKS